MIKLVLYILGDWTA